MSWNYYLQNPGNEFFEDFLYAVGLTPKSTESLAKRKFTNVHLLAMGLSAPDVDECQELAAYLRSHPEEVDIPDTLGRTPVCWAASRQDLEIVTILLKHKASVLHADKRMQTPLHYCAGSGSARTMKLLLEQARKSVRSVEDLDPALKPSSPLALHDIVDARDTKGRTPLNFATRMDFPAHAQLLIPANADMECADDQYDKTILLFALYWNSHAVLPILLESGARTDVVDARQATILHHAARYADLETLTILSNHDLGIINVAAVDDAGNTANDIMNAPNERMVRESDHRRQKSKDIFQRMIESQTHARMNRSGYVTEISSDEDARPGAANVAFRTLSAPT